MRQQGAAAALTAVVLAAATERTASGPAEADDKRFETSVRIVEPTVPR
jgi:hypothetical protein